MVYNTVFILLRTMNKKASANIDYFSSFTNKVGMGINWCYIIIWRKIQISKWFNSAIYKIQYNVNYFIDSISKCLWENTHVNLAIFSNKFRFHKTRCINIISYDIFLSLSEFIVDVLKTTCIICTQLFNTSL